MSLTFVLLLLISLLVILGIITKKLNILTYSPPDKNGVVKPNGVKVETCNLYLRGLCTRTCAAN